MIFVSLQGGLGNQCFQYAAGRALSMASGQPLKLDLSGFSREARGTTPRSYELDKLKVEAPRASEDEMRVFALRPGLLFRMRRRLSRLAGVRPPGGRVLRDGDHRFRPLQADPERDTCLDGYWASEKYFDSIAGLLRQELVPRDAPAGRNAELLSRLAGEESASVHVRRGDYVSLPQARAFHGLCGEDYYRRACEILKREFAGIRFYVFSDDPAWCRRHLGFLDGAEFLDHNGPGQGHWDMRLMSACRRHVIANSSLSWWGAWLDPREDKRVIAPAQWFSPESQADSLDVCPPSWQRL